MATYPAAVNRLRTPVLLGLAVTCVVALAGCGGADSDAASSDAVPTPAHSIGTSLDRPLPRAIRHLPFTDAKGHTVHLSDFKGKTIVISDIMTLCQESCPLDTATTVQTARDEDHAGHHANTVYLSITVDPQRDTTPQIAAYRKLFSPVPSNWHVLTGTPAHVNRLWHYFGVWHKKTTGEDDDGPAPRNWRTGKPLTYDVAHSDELFFLDGRQHERFVLEGMPVATKDEIPADLYRFMSKEGHHNVTAPQKTAWTEDQAKQILHWLRAA